MTPLDQVPWTKGEWRVGVASTRGDTPITATSKRGLTKPICYLAGYFKAERDANARLIAESPTMAALLERLMAAMKWRTHSLTEEERTALAEARELLERIKCGA